MMMIALMFLLIVPVLVMPTISLPMLITIRTQALPPSVLPGPELESAPSLAPSSSDTPGNHDDDDV